MSRFNDPRLRRTLNQLGRDLETANEQAQVGIYRFSKNYIDPCFAGVADCVRQCTDPCFSSDEEWRKRQRARSRGRLEHSFDFYDDWDEEEQDLIGWENDEFEQLLGDQSGSQPGRERVMNYGTQKKRPQRKSAAPPHDSGPDPTIIPQSSYFGFLDRLPWKMNKGIRYKPSDADLTEHPGTKRFAPAEEEEALMDESDDEAAHFYNRSKRRDRRGTTTSGHTTDSRSSRGDIFPSEDELDDAVPFDEEFAMALGRRSTSNQDESSSGKTKSRKGSRLSLRTTSSKSARDLLRTPSTENYRSYQESSSREPPTLSELKAEEDSLRKNEDDSVDRKRRAAKRLAMRRGLSLSDTKSRDGSLRISSSPPVTELSSKSPSITGVIPFPNYDHARTPGSQTPAEEFAPTLEPQSEEAELEPEDEVRMKDYRIGSLQKHTKPPPPESTQFIPAALPSFSASPG